jgi:hypothetical protein
MPDDRDDAPSRRRDNPIFLSVCHTESEDEESSIKHGGNHQFG